MKVRMESELGGCLMGIAEPEEGFKLNKGLVVTRIRCCSRTHGKPQYLGNNNPKGHENWDLRACNLDENRDSLMIFGELSHARQTRNI
ncbi:hypothetical protein Trydic_g11504 [Trypoxylus dichotomus]